MLALRIASFLLLVSLAPSAIADCVPQNLSPSVTICDLKDGSLVDTVRLRLIARTTDEEARVTVMQVWVDGMKSYEQVGSSENGSTFLFTTALDIENGQHWLTVTAYDSMGRKFSSTVRIIVQREKSVTCEPPGLTPPLPSVNICFPVTVIRKNPDPIFDSYLTPFNLFGAVRSNHAITHVRVYLNATPVYDQRGNGSTYLLLNALINAAPGRYRLTVQAWDSTGKVFNSKVYITVI